MSTPSDVLNVSIANDILMAAFKCSGKIPYPTYVLESSYEFLKTLCCFLLRQKQYHFILMVKRNASMGIMDITNDFHKMWVTTLFSLRPHVIPM